MYTIWIMEIWYIVKLENILQVCSKMFDWGGIVWNVFLYFWCVLYYKLLFWMRLSEFVYFLYIGTYFKCIFDICWTNVPEVWTIFVRTIFLRLFGIFGVLNGPPPTPIPIPGVNVKLPFRGKEIRKIIVFLRFNDFCDFFWKNVLN